MSRIISHALRHHPGAYGLDLDGEGWVDVRVLVSAIRAQSDEWRDLAEQDIERMVRTAAKQRHDLVNGRIRAAYGHSVATSGWTAAEPPPRLFHGTTPEATSAILRDGLLPMQRRYVHLSVDRETAAQVGQRRTALPVVFVIRAREAAASGVMFCRAGDEVWLAERVPAEFLDLTA